MTYFSCEGRFSHLYAYHIKLLMQFTRVRMMNLPYFMCRNIEKMTTLVQQKTPQQQFNSIYQFSLINIVVIHQLGLQGITWEDFISREFFTAPQGPPEALHDACEPSYQYEGHETQTASMPVFVTYQKGTRRLFAAVKRVLSPLGVEGVSLPSSAQQVQDKGKRSLQDEGSSSEH